MNEQNFYLPGIKYTNHIYLHLTPGSWLSEQHNKNRYFSNTYLVKSTWNCYVLYFICGSLFTKLWGSLNCHWLVMLWNRLNYYCKIHQLLILINKGFWFSIVWWRCVLDLCRFSDIPQSIKFTHQQIYVVDFV